jgi:hypothetical protein
MLVENNEANLTSKTKGIHPLLLLILNIKIYLKIILLFFAQVFINIYLTIEVRKSMNQSWGQNSLKQTNLKQIIVWNVFFFIELRTSTCHMLKWDVREDMKECKKKSWPLSPPHIVNIVQLDYIQLHLAILSL